MFFTQQDYEKIENWLSGRGGKDSSFPKILAPEEIKVNSFIALVQDNANATVSIDKLSEKVVSLRIKDNEGRDNNVVFSQAGVQALLDKIKQNTSDNVRHLQSQITDNKTNIGEISTLPDSATNTVEAIKNVDTLSKLNKKNIGDVNSLIDGEQGNKNVVHSIKAVDQRVKDTNLYIDSVKNTVDDNIRTITNQGNQIAALENRSDVVDVVKSHAELIDYNVSEITDNDIIKVLKDETQKNAITYYKYHKNNIPSKWEFIGSLAAYYTIEESDNQNKELKDLIAQGYVYAGKIISLEFKPTIEPKVSSFWQTTIKGNYPNLTTETGTIIKNNDGLSYITYNVESKNYGIVDSLILYQTLEENSPSNAVSQKAVQDALDARTRTFDGGRADTIYGGVNIIDCGNAAGEIVK